MPEGADGQDTDTRGPSPDMHQNIFQSQRLCDLPRVTEHIYGRTQHLIQVSHALCLPPEATVLSCRLR